MKLSVGGSRPRKPRRWPGRTVRHDDVFSCLELCLRTTSRCARHRRTVFDVQRLPRLVGLDGAAREEHFGEESARSMWGFCQPGVQSPRDSRQLESRLGFVGPDFKRSLRVVLLLHHGDLQCGLLR